MLHLCKPINIVSCFYETGRKGTPAEDTGILRKNAGFPCYTVGKTAEEQGCSEMMSLPCQQGRDAAAEDKGWRFQGDSGGLI